MSTSPLNILARVRRRKGPSVMYFTVHKAGSTYLKTIIEALATAKGLTTVDYAAEYLKTDFRAFEELAYNPVGHSYGPFRWFMPIDRLEDYRLLLHLRDPRDALVSQYFSFGFSHDERNAQQVERKKQIQQMGIEAYVLDSAPKTAQRYRGYVEHLAGRPNLLFVKYEQMVTDFDAWLDAVADHLELADPKAIRRLKQAHVSNVEQEDPSQHVRQITPGDHLRKLDTGTIDRLNDILGDVLAAFDYPLRAQDPLAS